MFFFFNLLLFPFLVTLLVSEDGVVSLKEVGGLQGMYIANAILSHKGNTASLVTYDHGATWFQLAPPASQACNSELCRLNLYQDHGTVKKGSYTAKGLILSTGQVMMDSTTHGGENVTNRDQKGNLYISLDAGVVWREIFGKTQMKMYDYTNYGAVIGVVVDDEFSFSSSYGESFTTCSLNLPKGYQSVHLLGSQLDMGFFLLAENVSSQQALAIHLNLEDTLVRKCLPREYEKWLMKTPLGDTCVLGTSRHYTRKKAGSICYVEEKELVPSRVPCQCGPEDFFCNHCYRREPFDPERHIQGDVRNCVWYCSSDMNPHPPPEECGLPSDHPNYITEYPVRTGDSPYRKNELSQCVNGS
eukprot:TRINITY_DN5469_c0_g1_i6.p1 TRINITY_DN5469_c0_g1~~TRINITY_DN5469_c0_g1_i6.p1  ORF type:complete len:358 (-),score=81.31 TRINITY_DN5469_c0_g1_i6:441-1514(-)